MREEREDARKREEKGKKKRLRGGDGERKRFQPDSTHHGEPPSFLAPLPFHRHGAYIHTDTQTYTHTRFFGMNQIIG